MGDRNADAEGTEPARSAAGSGARQAGGTTGEARAALGPVPAAAGSDQAAARREVADTRAHAERSAIYHKARQGFLDTIHRWTMFAVIVSGSAAVAGVADSYAPGKIAVALLPVIFGALDMAFAPSIRAREHALLAKRFLELAAKCVSSDADRAAMHADLYQLYAEEAPTYKAVDAMAHNQLCDVSSLPEQKLRVPFHARALRHLYRFSGTEFLPVPSPRERA